MDRLPLVSICCVTYNHAPYIRNCLEGFLMQKTSFPVEILIHDDASTDGTDEIIREYARLYPEKFFPLIEEENQYSKPNHKCPDFYNYERARGKYIAYCEGDDYWTDPLKLQKQVDFLESNPQYSVCWHRYRKFYIKDNTWGDDRCAEILPSNSDGVEIDIPTFFSAWYTQPLTMVFRKSCFCFEWSQQYKYYRDEHESFHLLNAGKGYLFSFVGGVYVIHGSGLFSAEDGQKQSRISCEVAHELYSCNKNLYTRHYYEDILRWAVYQHADNFHQKAQYAIKLFLLNGKLKSLIKNLLR